METRRLTIRGRVQGVGYRDALCGEASRLGIDGWVRNRADGSVEALVCGSAPALDALVAWARRGPALARVLDVHVEDGDAAPEPGFRRLPTL